MKKCAVCGSPIKFISSSCADGKICSNCSGKIPEVYDFSLSRLSKGDIENLFEYDKRQEELRSKFLETSSYSLVHLDSHHGILALCENSFIHNGEAKEGAFMIPMETISSFSFSMVPKKSDENKVIASISVSITALDIPEIHALYLTDDVCSVENYDQGTVSYSYPLGVKFLWDEVVRVNNRIIEEHKNSPMMAMRENLDFVRAAGLFMVDLNFTKSLIKKRRNQLIKAFHTDAGGSEECAQQINKAYELLLEYAKED